MDSALAGYSDLGSGRGNPLEILGLTTAIPAESEALLAAVRWETGALTVELSASADRPVSVQAFGPAADVPPPSAASQPLVELIITGDGRARTTTRFTNSGVGTRLRYREHHAFSDGEQNVLEVVQADPLTGLVVTTRLTASNDVSAARVVTEVTNQGQVPVVLEAVTSFAFGAVIAPGERTTDLQLHSGTGEQLAENRWTTRPLWSQSSIVDFSSLIHNQPGRGSFEAVGISTWSTARVLPTAALSNAVTGRAFAWQIEHNGGWRWEVDNVRVGEGSIAVLMMGPNDIDHHFSQGLAPGESFTSVPVSVAVSGDGFEGAVAALTRHRRWLRRRWRADRRQLLVFNDYMNTLNGDPTTERLLPLIAAAQGVGAECFCIDAGWYDDTGDWWPSIGAWTPSTPRFPDGGLQRVVSAIRDAGMQVGLWLEPEAVGVASPIAAELPDAAFLQRHGRRVVEHQRLFLDLRHPAAQAHLDATFDRLVSEFDVGFFKLDYNVTPGAGTDWDAFSVGAGLLAHNRAYLDWFERLRARHPHLVFENCSSGAMRADFAQLERFDFQSTSDQQDFLLYPVIAAAAPVQMLPEQAGNWAYPQPSMSDEEIAFNLVTGLAGRLYLSGFVDSMSAAQLKLVTDGAELFKTIRSHTASSVPSWPTGLPDWYAPSLSLLLSSPDKILLYVWQRGTDDIRLALGAVVTAEWLVERYPRRLTPWTVTDEADGTIVLRPGVNGPTARIYEVTDPNA